MSSILIIIFFVVVMVGPGLIKEITSYLTVSERTDNKEREGGTRTAEAVIFDASKEGLYEGDEDEE